MCAPTKELTGEKARELVQGESVANEQIRLDFLDFDPDRAHWMVDVARHFAVSKLGGQSGLRHGTVYRDSVKGNPITVIAYYTASRMVVVREKE